MMPLFSLILSLSFTNRYFITWVADYTDNIYLKYITSEREIKLKDTFLGICCCKLIVLLITVYINWFALQPWISFHNQRQSRSNQKHSFGFRRGPVASISSSLAQWHIFGSTEWAVVPACKYTHTHRYAHAPIITCKFYPTGLMYITVDGGDDGRWGEEEGGGEERGRLVLVRCLVSVETDGVEKTNYLFLIKD